MLVILASRVTAPRPLSHEGVQVRRDGRLLA